MFGYSPASLVSQGLSMDVFMPLLPATASASLRLTTSLLHLPQPAAAGGGCSSSFMCVYGRPSFRRDVEAVLVPRDGQPRVFLIRTSEVKVSQPTTNHDGRSKPPDQASRPHGCPALPSLPPHGPTD